MAVIVLQIVGWVAFVGGTLLIGTWLRQHRDKATADSRSWKSGCALGRPISHTNRTYLF
jgi:hypothetical protein